MTLEELKLYLRVDGNDEDANIQSLWTAATNYIQRQTGKTKVRCGDGYISIENDELYNLCVKLMVAHWYSNRGVEIPGTLTKIAHSVDPMIKHISMCEDYV